MAHFIADAIRAHIGAPQSDSDRALLAVLDECEAMRAQPGPFGAHAAIADDLEATIADELGIEP